jgi:hypothetical protein
MDEVIHSLTAGKIRELLALCGIGDHSEEPIKHHVLGISNFGEHSSYSLRQSTFSANAHYGA